MYSEGAIAVDQSIFDTHVLNVTQADLDKFKENDAFVLNNKLKFTKKVKDEVKDAKKELLVAVLAKVNAATTIEELKDGMRDLLKAI